MRNTCFLIAAMALSGCAANGPQINPSPSSVPPAPFLRFGTAPVPPPVRAVAACTPDILYAEGHALRPQPSNCPKTDPTDLRQPYAAGRERRLLEDELREVETVLNGGGSNGSGAGNLPRGFLKQRQSQLRRAILRLERQIV